MSLQLVRYAVAAAIALVVVALLLVIAVSLVRGVQPQEIVGLLAFVGTLVGLIVNLLGTQAVASNLRGVGRQVTDVQSQINGHLDDHVDRLSPEHLQGMADQAARQAVEQVRQEPPTRAK